ncbi:TetR/AcrR family transcriptional regulator [Nocardiopsis sp. YSL2]|uniref:TetR/AcrR family transcriptional regulator n=1 Tax=Nocardiopsis sp. YSL2 TaxID=2939492 RepID=UPI0026F46A96|nr:TetR/AcrR family transcriptional regulator [Nocardiopsis sp. YSL2]
MTRADRGQPVDRRVRRTQSALQGALTELIKDQDLSRVSVADVVKQAGVSRSTFYDHYRDVHELSEAACTAVIDSVVDTIPKPDPGNATTNLLLFFTNLAEHAGLFRSVLGPQGSARVIDHLRRRTTQACHTAMVDVLGGDGSVHSPSRADAPYDVAAAFVAGALISTAIDWLQNDCPRTPDEMAALTWPMLTALYPDVRSMTADGVPDQV